MKIKIKIDDPQTRAVWEAAQKAKDEVEGWPAWKKGEEPIKREEGTPGSSPGSTSGESQD